MRTPLSHVLSDFGRPVPRPTPQKAFRDAAPAPALTAVATGDTTRLVDEAYARGEREGRSAAEAELKTAMAEAQVRTEEAFEAERQKWRSEHADELAARLASGVDELESKISAAVARVLTPFLTDRLRADMLDALGESVRTLVSGGHGAALHIRGPEELLTALREKLDPLPVGIEWEVGQDADVRVAADQTVIETDIQRWTDRFAEACR